MNGETIGLTSVGAVIDNDRIFLESDEALGAVDKEIGF
jgi:hypothetical protein